MGTFHPEARNVYSDPATNWDSTLRLTAGLPTIVAAFHRVRPAWSVAFAAVVAAFTLFTAGQEGPEPAEQEGIAQFVGRFPEAQSVHAVPRGKCQHNPEQDSFKCNEQDLVPAARPPWSACV